MSWLGFEVVCRLQLVAMAMESIIGLCNNISICYVQSYILVRKSIKIVTNQSVGKESNCPCKCGLATSPLCLGVNLHGIYIYTCIYIYKQGSNCKMPAMYTHIIFVFKIKLLLQQHDVYIMMYGLEFATALVLYMVFSYIRARLIFRR